MSGVQGPTSCRNDINACSPEDQWASEGVNATVKQRGNPEPGKHVTPFGDGYRTVKEESNAVNGGKRVAKKIGTQAGEAAGGVAVGQKLEKGAHHLLNRASDALKKFGEKAIPVASFALHVYEGTKFVSELHEIIVHDARNQGRLENEALLRDAEVAVIMAGAGPALSEGFKKQVAERFTPESRKIAETSVTHLTKKYGARGYQARMTAMRNHAKAGIDAVKQRKLTSADELKQALAKDPAFAKRFESDTAFRLGVSSAIYDAEHAAKK